MRNFKLAGIAHAGPYKLGPISVMQIAWQAIHQHYTTGETAFVAMPVLTNMPERQKGQHPINVDVDLANNAVHVGKASWTIPKTFNKDVRNTYGTGAYHNYHRVRPRHNHP